MADPLTVAVTGPTGTFGHGLMPLFEKDDRIGKVIGIARRPFEPSEHGWSKMHYRQGDVRDRAGLTESFVGADVVVHLAFLVVGGSRDETRSINVEGTLNAVRAAADAGVQRFVYASSVAAYGFHRDNPVGMRETWPVRRASSLFYAQEKAELELLLQEEMAALPDLELYLLRPPIVVGPNAVGGKGPAVLQRWGLRRFPVPLPVPVPDLPLQLIHERDVGSALLQCVVGGGPQGAYNIAADDVISTTDLVRGMGLLPVALPSGPSQRVARAVAKIPGLPSYAEWVEAFSHPAVMDTTKAKSLLGWAPRYTAREAWQDTLSPGKGTTAP